MNHVAALLISACISLSSPAAMAATPQTGNRASMLSLILVAGVMIVGVKLAIAYARRKMEDDFKSAPGKPDSEAQKNDSKTNA
ncbi:MAG: hypothetical protein GX576_10205 [Thauera phenolivorans]|uniref:Uncharacterized protein n=1 Tax=Thauera phenolivorans TaxID=1792543 RepID=A0A7X7LX06_9RHOO|nr:hypothetical protein [Thauera phenolivorans]NLF54744.1 hypothetical protein [Thauera phenolivorans]